MQFASKKKIISGSAMMLLSVFVSACSGSTDISDLFGSQPNSTIQEGQIVGGATKQMAVDTTQVGKFLPRPDLLAPGGPGRADLVYLNPNIKFANYRKVMIDPVTMWAGPHSPLASVPADQQQVLANAAYSDIYNALRAHCQMVQVASPDTIHFHFALVDTKEPDAFINTVATYAPYASSAYSATSFLFNKGVGYFAGTATGEGFATDATNGTLLWQAVDKRGGTTTFVANTFDNWRDIRHTFEAWGLLLSERLQQLGVCHA
jgi:hypothetical protein